MTISTKETILQVASQLFADNGYDNTSIRDIAKGAEVNISAINYHFSSKNGLYAEVLNQNTQRMSTKMKELRNDISNAEDFAIAVYDYFMDESNIFFNSFKMFFTNNLPLDKEIMPKVCIDDAKGPPGVTIIMEIIKEEINFTGEDKLLLWAARTILHNIIILSLLSQSSLIKMMNEEIQHFDEEEKIESIRRNVRSTLNFIK